MKYTVKKEVEEFYYANEEQIIEAWDDYLDNLQDSSEHRAYLRYSEACFWEFVEELYNLKMEAV